MTITLYHEPSNMHGPYRSDGWGEFCDHCTDRMPIVWSGDLTNPEFGIEEMVHLCEPCWQECLVERRSTPSHFTWKGPW